jgi:hypothetical protein
MPGAIEKLYGRSGLMEMGKGNKKIRNTDKYNEETISRRRM